MWAFPGHNGTVVVGCDSSGESQNAVVEATQEASRRGSELVLLSVAEHRPYWPDSLAWVARAEAESAQQAQAAADCACWADSPSARATHARLSGQYGRCSATESNTSSLPRRDASWVASTTAFWLSPELSQPTTTVPLCPGKAHMCHTSPRTPAGENPPPHHHHHRRSDPAHHRAIGPGFAAGGCPCPD